MVVESFVTMILEAVPNKFNSTLSKRKPNSSVIKVPSVKLQYLLVKLYENHQSLELE